MLTIVSGMTARWSALCSATKHLGVEECRHEMNPAWCALCLGQVTGRDPLGSDVVISAAFQAEYRGVCEVCDSEITPGDSVCRVRSHPDDPGEVVHDDCAQRGELYV